MSGAEHPEPPEAAPATTARRDPYAALRFRDLQHSHATRLVGAGLPVSVIQKAKGPRTPPRRGAICTHAPSGSVATWPTSNG